MALLKKPRFLPQRRKGAKILNLAHVGFWVKRKCDILLCNLTQEAKRMIQFPITELRGQQECYNFLMEILHPAGLKCPCGHPLSPDQAPHDRSRDPIFDYRCRECGKVFNIFTGTVWARYTLYQPDSRSGDAWYCSRYSCPPPGSRTAFGSWHITRTPSSDSTLGFGTPMHRPTA